MAALAGAPPKELDVPNATKPTYKNFIESWRRDVATPMSTHNVPMLVPRQNPPARTFDVVLRGYVSEITLRTRADDLYLVGYLQKDKTQWYEFNENGGAHLIPGSDFLPFHGNYTSLVGHRRENIELGKEKLANGVDKIATSRNTNDHKDPLVVVIQMICEAIRFTRISKHLVDNFYQKLPPTAEIVNLENNWGAISEGLRRVDANPTAQFLPVNNVLGFTRPAEGAAVLGVALYYCFKSSHIAATRAMIPPMADGLCFVYGRPLVEVYQVRINDINGKDPADLYGKITVTDGLLGSRDMYSVERSNAQSVSPRDFVLLTGPPRSIEAGDIFTIDVALMNRGRDPSFDHEVSKGEIFWTFFTGTNVFDKVINHEIKGKYGSATVNYIVFSDAVTATIEVKLIKGGGKNPADVYGSIVAKNSDFQDESTLFKRGSKKDIKVRPGELIPLSRSVVAVSSNSSLRINASLWDRDSLSSDYEIANGTAEFPVQLSGTYQKSITGEYGEVQVKVTWA